MYFVGSVEIHLVLVSGSKLTWFYCMDQLTSFLFVWWVVEIDLCWRRDIKTDVG